jgi:chloride channel protein, CIC family
MRHSILTEKLARRGRPVAREYIVNPMRLLEVADVMERDVPTVPGSLKITELFRRLLRDDPLHGRRHAWPLVDDEGHLVGILTRGDLVGALDEPDGPERETALELGSKRLIVAYPDELLETAAERMLQAEVGRLPVVRRDDPRVLVGYLGRAEVLAAWLQAARDEQDEPGWLDGVSDRVRGALRRAFSSARHA